MSRHIWVRPARSEDGQKFVEWSLKTKNNLFDPEAALGPSGLTVCAYGKAGPILYAPTQSPIFMEALAINPDAEPTEVAVALKEVVHFLVSQCHIRGINEIYFMCADDSTAEFAKRQAFEEIPHRLFRLKIKDLERG